MAKPTADFSGIDVLQVAADLAAVRQPFALVIVVEARGSAAVRTGAKTILDGEGTVLAGWVGGGSTASAIVRAAIESLQTETPQLIDLDLDERCLPPESRPVASCESMSSQSFPLESRRQRADFEGFGRVI